MITNKCPFCKRRVWFWNKRVFFEITPDWGLYAHKNCFSNNKALKYIDNWFKDILKEIDGEKK